MYDKISPKLLQSSLPHPGDMFSFTTLKDIGCVGSHTVNYQSTISPPPSVLNIKLTVPAALVGFEVKATTSPQGYTGNSPSRTQTSRQSHCACRAALGSAPPRQPTAGRAPSVGQPAPGEPAGNGRTWRHG